MRLDTAVTGVLVTGKVAERFPLAQRAVLSWQRQADVPNRELLVINDHPDIAMYPDGPPAGVREIRVPDRKTLGELRNIGIDNATTDYLIQWDDDDYSRGDRLCWQLQHTPEGRASIFRYEVHTDLHGKAFVNDGYSIRCRGFPGTMLWPRDVRLRGETVRFPHQGKREDTEFVLTLQVACGVAILNNDPTLYCRFYHGDNTWDEKHVMRPKLGARGLNLTERCYVDALLLATTQHLAETRGVATP